MKPNPNRLFQPALALLLLMMGLVFSVEALAQKRTTNRRKVTPARRIAAIDYTRFSHSTKQHQENCKSCHQAPTPNWKKASSFPDVVDFPGHDSCVRCHRQQFFKGAQPPICTVCHTKVSPRHDARFSFPNSRRPEQFQIDFPHDKHQDVIASLQSFPVFGQRPASLLVKSAHVRSASFAVTAAPDEGFNNCTICHGANAQPVPTPKGGWPDAFAPPLNAFKAVPEKHDACFNCHWQSQEPVRDNCGGCHKLVPASHTPPTTERISIKFTHEGGCEKKNHIAECTTCHINITKAATLRGLKPDVPITGCTECHNKEGLRQDLSKELATLDKDHTFACVYCHATNVGKRDAPPSHYLVAERPPLKRAELK
jgi:Class III cytochrome C family